MRPHGQNGGAPPLSQQRPQTARTPLAAASSARTLTRAVLPIPGSPATSTKPPWPDCAAVRAVLSSSSSRSRPTKVAQAGAARVRVPALVSCRLPIGATPSTIIDPALYIGNLSLQAPSARPIASSNVRRLPKASALLHRG